MADHAKLSPSASATWMGCAGAPAAIAKLPVAQQDVPSDKADLGTIKHEILATCLEDSVAPTSFVGRTMNVNHEHYPDFVHVVNAEDAAQVQVAISYVRERMAYYGAGTKVLIEERVPCGENFQATEMNMDTFKPEVVRVPFDDCYGTADVVLIGNGYLEVIDFKTGTWKVHAKDNQQMLLYALGALRELSPGQVQRCRLTIVQPPCDPPVDPWEFPSDGDNKPFDHTLMDWALKFGTAARATLDPNAKRTPGEEQCKWCAAKATDHCPESIQAAMAPLLVPPPAVPAAGDIPPPPEPPPGDIMQALGVPVENLSQAHLVAIYHAAGMIRSTIGAVEDRIRTEMLAKVDYPGLKLVAGRKPNRKWTQDDTAMRKRFGNVSRIGDDGKAAGKLPKDTYVVEAIISAPQAEKHIKPLVSEKTWSNLSKLISGGDGIPTVVDISDPRPDIRVTAAEAFDSIGTPSESPSIPDFLR